MLIERDGSDTPPSRFAFPVNQPTQHNPVHQNSCGVVWGNGPLLPVFSSFPTAQFEVLAAKAAILAGSVTAAVLGMIYMSVVCKHPSPKDE